jgi:diguanylate cyclase (GGDEF)-like protein
MASRRPPVIAYLLGVVVLPLVALGSLVLVQVRSLQSTNDLARRFQREVESGAAWVELRVAVEDERLFVESLATTKDLGVPVSLVTTLTGVDFEAEAAFARERTDEALASVDVSGLTGEIADLERARADGASRDIVRAAFNALEQAGSVEVTARQAAVRAASAGLPLADGVHSDLDALWGLEDYSSQVRLQLSALFAYLSATSPDQQRAAQDRLVVAEAETQGIRAGLTITAPSWARRLDEVESRPSVQLIERQITMTRELQAQLAHAATHDALTGLTNRTALSHHLSDLLAEGATNEREYGILFIDLDGFKQVNDQLGHAAGDAVLIEVADRLRRLCRATDLVARIGGDEFVFVLSKPAHREDIDHVAERILASLSEPYDIADNLARIGASIGVAISTGTQDPDELLRHADEALYRAKARGRGRIHYEDRCTAIGDHR